MKIPVTIASKKIFLGLILMMSSQVVALSSWVSTAGIFLLGMFGAENAQRAVLKRNPTTKIYKKSFKKFKGEKGYAELRTNRLHKIEYAKYHARQIRNDGFFALFSLGGAGLVTYAKGKGWIS